MVTSPSAKLRVGIVHDYLAQIGGAERVVEAIHRIYPDAPIYTSVFEPKSTLPYFQGKDVRTSFLQRTPFGKPRWHRLALFLYPAAFEHFDLSGYDVIISSSSSFAKGVITNPDCCHICYCHTPARFAWRSREYFPRVMQSNFLRPMLSAVISNLRAWDVVASNRVDYFIANSHNIAERIQKFYHRSSHVIYPPVETNRFDAAPLSEVGDHFLVVSRLVNYKRIDLAIDACLSVGAELRVIGDGPEGASLKTRGGSRVKFLGRQSNESVAWEMARCRALIVPGEEDFGITPLECMASGRPVIAYGAGGALETVIDGETGILFPDQTIDSLADAIRRTANWTVDPARIVRHARQFDTTVFQEKFEKFVIQAVKDHHSKRIGRPVSHGPRVLSSEDVEDP